MKRFAMAIFMILTFTAFSVCADAYIIRTNDKLISLLESCFVASENENFHLINDTCQKATEIWNSSQAVYNFLIHTEKIDSFNDNFEFLLAHTDSQDYKDIKTIIIQCIQKLEDISESEKISLKNIL